MAPNNKPPETATYQAAKDLWFSLPARERSVRAVTERLNQTGHKVSKTSVGRWAKEWQEGPQPVEEVAERLLPAPESSADDVFEGISDELRNALSPRLLAITEGEGLTRCENAVVKLADAIAERAPDIAAQLLDAESETTETTSGDDGEVAKKVTEKAKVARSAVQAIATLAQAMSILTQAKHLSAMSHRNFAEGDMLLAQAERHRQEARKVSGEADAIAGRNREHDAKLVGGEVLDNGSGDDAEAEARRALFDKAGGI